MNSLEPSFRRVLSFKDKESVLEYVYIYTVANCHNNPENIWQQGKDESPIG